MTLTKEHKGIYVVGLLSAVGVIITLALANVYMRDVHTNFRTIYNASTEATKLVDALANEEVISTKTSWVLSCTQVDEDTTQDEISEWNTDGVILATTDNECVTKLISVNIPLVTGNAQTCDVEYNGKYGIIEKGTSTTDASTPTTTQPIGETACITCLDAIDIVNDVFYNGENEKYAFNSQEIGKLYKRIDEYTAKHNATVRCDALVRGEVSNRINQLGRIATEFYVLEKTQLALWISLGMFVGGIIIVGVSDYMTRVMDTYTAYHVCHWLYTACAFFSIFTFLVAYTITISREFWVQSWHVLGVGSHGLDFDSPRYDAMEIQTHNDVAITFMAAFVCHIVSFAAHFTLKYGAVGRFVSKIEDQFLPPSRATATRTASQFPHKTTTFSSTKVQYAPLASVARRMT